MMGPNIIFKSIYSLDNAKIETHFFTSQNKTNLPKDAPVKEMKFELSGNLNRHLWSLDNKVVSEADKILIKKGENVRVVLYNGSIMRHDMHGYETETNVGRYIGKMQRLMPFAGFDWRYRKWE